tara:strand:+ start:1634 stop:1963 length:330 start_codon:yes stop_codon:yes gene_type:complete
MEEEMRQGMMGADVQSDTTQPMEVSISASQVSSNLQNLSEEEQRLITQLNVPQFRNFMSKVFGSEFGRIMEVSIPEPQVAQPQQTVSQQSESPAPMTGQGMMTQPPVTA